MHLEQKRRRMLIIKALKKRNQKRHLHKQAVLMVVAGVVPAHGAVLGEEHLPGVVLGEVPVPGVVHGAVLGAVVPGSTTGEIISE